MTFDGLHQYACDAWGRMTSATRSRAGDGLRSAAQVPVPRALPEPRDASGHTLKQHLWGARYIDELVHVAVNTDPAAHNTCDPPSRRPLRRAGANYYATQNLPAGQAGANFNPPSPRRWLRRAGVLGITDPNGVLVERYEYTPYGQRTVYRKSGPDDALTTAPLYHSQQVADATTRHPYTLCDIGHQGLLHDREFGLVQNRYRYLPPTGKWHQRDPMVYADGMGLYECLASDPVSFVDPDGARLRIDDRGNTSAYGPVSKWLTQLCPCVGFRPDDNGWLRMTKRPGGTLKSCCECTSRFSAGCRLLKDLIEHPSYGVTITNKSLRGSEGYFWPFSNGSGGIVYLDMASLAALDARLAKMAVPYGGGTDPADVTPAYIIMAHELAHAFSLMPGTERDPKTGKTRTTSPPLPIRPEGTVGTYQEFMGRIRVAYLADDLKRDNAEVTRKCADWHAEFETWAVRASNMFRMEYNGELERRYRESVQDREGVQVGSFMSIPLRTEHPHVPGAMQNHDVPLDQLKWIAKDRDEFCRKLFPAAGTK